MRISDVKAIEVLGSRGFPTVEAAVWIEDRYVGSAIAPAGASKGSHEAFELRDGERRWMGRGVRKAVHNVNTVIRKALIGVEAEHVDDVLLSLDDSGNKSKLGANAVLAVSLASARAAANYKGIPLYRYIQGLTGAKPVIPTPMVNMISGGHHAAWNLDLQDLLIIPLKAENFSQALEYVGLVYHTLKRTLAERGYSTLLADEGGFSPRCRSHEEAFELLLTSIEESGFKPGHDIGVAVDVAATHLYSAGFYNLRLENLRLSPGEMVDYITRLCERYPIISVEDGCSEDDWDGWRNLTKRLGGRVQLLGDDPFTTDVKRIRRGVEEGVANSVLIKPNQVGTLRETLEAVKYCFKVGYTPVVSARSGDTEDSFISDLAVGAGVTQIKIGSIARSERTSKYNRLLRIEDELSGAAEYLAVKSMRLPRHPIG
ncbi:Enolase [Candidatus Calditenuaceae archaeon HR02]|nr:Enolase [Candidatus Calditenuaceae archaeon HR02]